MNSSSDEQHQNDINRIATSGQKIIRVIRSPPQVHKPHFSAHFVNDFSDIVC